MSDSNDQDNEFEEVLLTPDLEYDEYLEYLVEWFNDRYDAIKDLLNIEAGAVVNATFHSEDSSEKRSIEITQENLKIFRLGVLMSMGTLGSLPITQEDFQQAGIAEEDSNGSVH